MSSKQLSTKGLPAQITAIGGRLKRYSLPVFLVFVAVIYGFVLLRINNLSQAEPSDQAVTSQVQAAKIPHIDAAVVKQLETLQDNSVSVQSLFDEARSNPFQ